ncbi:hypothetical protein [Bauldia sp.]|uniref:hypothetical protein n=1 Tax=Bauldia sp. TaxID=2575872 RepID=UPI003BA97C18
MNRQPAGTTECTSSTQGIEHLAGLSREWAYARASEASTLFLNRSLASSPPFMRITEKPGPCLTLFSYDGHAYDEYTIRRVERSGEERTLFLENPKWQDANTITFVIYPYLDIDDTWVVIQDIPGLEEKPVRFAVPAHLAHRIEIMPDGYP